MRETIVRELFAHDREDLARTVARAPLATISAIGDREIAAARAGAPRKGRLTIAALAFLSGDVDVGVPPRSRSPILEMPADLRAVAARNAARDRLTGDLGSVRRSRRAWGGCRIAADRGSAEAAVTVRSGPDGIVATLRASSSAELAAAGWRRAGEVWQMHEGQIDAEAREALADHLIVALELALDADETPLEFRVERADEPAEAVEIEMQPGSRILPSPPGAEDLLVFARDWLDLLADDRFEDALAQLSLWPEDEREVMSAGLLREWIGNYGSWEPWSDGQAWRVTSPSETLGGWIQTADDCVIRDATDDRYGTFDVRMPLNGEWSDLTARFDYGPTSAGTGVALVDVLVP